MDDGVSFLYVPNYADSIKIPSSILPPKKIYRKIVKPIE